LIPLQRNPYLAHPKLSPDGSRLIYRDYEDRELVSFLATIEGIIVREVCRGCEIFSFLSDTRRVLFRPNPTELAIKDLENGLQDLILKVDEGSILDADISADDKWIVLMLERDSERSLYIMPFQNSLVKPEQLIPVVENSSYLMSPRISLSGDRLYFISGRDGGGCIWIQQLNPVSKQPIDEPYAVYHAHRGRLRMDTPRLFGSLTLTKDQLLFTLGEIKGNLFITQL